MKPLLGGKGANLAEMTRIGLPVPPGFTITTEVCTYYYANKRTYPKDTPGAGRRPASPTSKKSWAPSSATPAAMPLLVSVRSGARDSMPGMMDTILNLGLNDQTVLALAAATKNERFAWDCYRRFIQMYGDVVMGVQKRAGEDHEPFETVIHDFKHEQYHADIEDTKLTAEDQQELVKRFKALDQGTHRQGISAGPVEAALGRGRRRVRFLDERPRDCLSPQIQHSRPNGARPSTCRRWSYGNTGETSGSGVAFTRNPANGTKEFYGEFLINAQGEDVVAGVRTPEPVAQLAKEMPDAFKELDNIRATLEKHFKDVQDFEFTIQDGKVFMLQTRNGKRTAAAALKISDGHGEGKID